MIIVKKCDNLIDTLLESFIASAGFETLEMVEISSIQSFGGKR